MSTSTTGVETEWPCGIGSNSPWKKASPSTEIRCLYTHTYICACVYTVSISYIINFNCCIEALVWNHWRLVFHLKCVYLLYCMYVCMYVVVQFWPYEPCGEENRRCAWIEKSAVCGRQRWVSSIQYSYIHTYLLTYLYYMCLSVRYVGPMAHPIRPESYISMDNFCK